MNVIGIGQTDIGKQRDQNEDSLLVDNELGLYIVCDGMGGHAAGEVASTTAIEAVAASIRDEQGLIERVASGGADVQLLVDLAARAVQGACKEVYDLATSKREYSGMGCTLTMLAAASSRAVLAHVGDTRLYLVRDGQAHLLSADHTMAAEMARMGAIKQEEVKGHRYANVLTRAIGSQPSVQVDTLVIDLLPGDRLLLCSDGLTEYVEDTAWLANKVSVEDLESVPDELIAFANDAGGHDNITALVVSVEAERGERTVALAARADVQLRLDGLGSVFLFEDLPLAQLIRVLNVCQLRELRAGETVVAEGDRCSTLYVAVEGALAVSRAAGASAAVGSGGYVGETTILYPRRSRATVKASVPTRLLVLDREPLLGLLKARPWLGVALLQRLGRRLSRDLDNLHSRAAGGAGEIDPGSLL